MALTGNSTEEKIWNFLRDKIGNSYGAAGVMGNLYAESSFSPINLQQNGNSYFGWTDTEYTDKVNNGSHSGGFSRDGFGYGLAQWTYYTRKDALLKYANKKFNVTSGFSLKSKGGSIGDLEMQLEFLYTELSSSTYSKTLNAIKAATSVRQASDRFMVDFENPANQSEEAKRGRARLGETYYDRYASRAGGSDGVDITKTKGYKIVMEARKHIGKPYKFGGNGPDKFDCSGFVKYVYNTAIDYGMEERTAFTQYNNLGELVPRNQLKTGDLIFFVNTYASGNVPNISHVGIKLESGDYFIQASGDKVNIASLSYPYWDKLYYGAKRLLDPSQTYTEDGSGSSEDSEYTSESPIDTITGLSGGLPLTRVDEYAEELQNALDTLSSANESYCSLIDLTRGGEFKFYLPDDIVESLPVSWDTNSSIQGRSVPPTGYNNSGPRSIPLSIDLMAGAGYYDIVGKTHDEIMDIMYKDIYFLKSLAYPDYDYAIVQPPSVVLLSLGSNVKIRGVVGNLSVNYRKPIDSKNRAMRVTVNFTVTQVSDEPPGRSDVLVNNFRSY